MGKTEVQGVGLDDAQIGAQAAPVRFAPRLLQQLREAAQAGEAIHEPDVVLHAHQTQNLQRLSVRHQRRRLLPTGRRVAALQGGIHPVRHQKALEIPQAGVDPAVALFFLLVHAVQLGENDVKGFGQGRNVGDLLPVGAAGLLDTEIRIDQQQCLHGEIVRLQIPHGMVGGHMADVRELAAAEPQVGIVIVQVGHTLPRAAAELADVVAGSSAGHQRQIHGDAAFLQTAPHGDGDVVDAGDMLQSAEGRDLQTKAHHFIHILPLPKAQHLAVARRAGVVRLLLLAQKVEVP